ncbi:acyltransferase family protein [Chelatococcus reniformis]|uniref:Acyltransferase n=1 Tax=Chelatococcus reniformis TaxID=1494448 RepID=A0A916X7P9_9HYPH|nr:acyltransferase [Chelatococcus reniformis]GGC46555.1 acyltransferase [Chelatococcus reniformis]
MARDNNFELLRLFGAALVVYGHGFILAGAMAPGFAANAVSTIGVKIFFSISGYLIALSWLRDPNPARYLERRALRIFPALIAVVALSAFVLGPALTALSAADYVRHPLTWHYLYNILLYINFSLPEVFTGNTYPSAVNGNLWSLPVEFAMYLVAPPLLLALSRRPRVFVAAALLFALFVVWRVRVSPPATVWVVYATDANNALGLMPYFIVGMVIAVLGARILNIYAGFAMLMAVAMVETSAPVKELLLIGVLPYAILAFGVGPRLPVLPKGLDISYGLFLYSFPIQQTINQLSGNQVGPWAMVLLSMTLAAVPATLSWYLIEQPCLRFKPGRARRPSPGLASSPLGSPAAE